MFLHIYIFVEKSKTAQGCQLSDFSLGSKTTCYSADFSTTFSSMPKTTIFAHLIPKQPGSTLEFQYSYSILQKMSANPDKNGNSVPSPQAPSLPGQT